MPSRTIMLPSFASARMSMTVSPCIMITKRALMMTTKATEKTSITMPSRCCASSVCASASERALSPTRTNWWMLPRRTMMTIHMLWYGARSHRNTANPSSPAAMARSCHSESGSITKGGIKRRNLPQLRMGTRCIASKRTCEYIRFMADGSVIRNRRYSASAARPVWSLITTPCGKPSTGVSSSAMSCTAARCVSTGPVVPVAPPLPVTSPASVDSSPPVLKCQENWLDDSAISPGGDVFDPSCLRPDAESATCSPPSALCFPLGGPSNGDSGPAGASAESSKVTRRERRGCAGATIRPRPELTDSPLPWPSLSPIIGVCGDDAWETSASEPSSGGTSTSSGTLTGASKGSPSPTTAGWATASGSADMGTSRSHRRTANTSSDSSPSRAAVLGRR
mmetsp:Transcript_17636/g.54696  ORF Transcript_17636/g.54696 Transcript_17636/m.54696 type:complete len:395 (-) Transcript_17636:1504-2688(-)